MREIELKILLDESQEKRLRVAPALAAMATGRARTSTLQSVYYDTPDQALRAAGIALRLRRKGRSWVQTVKKAETPISGGLSQPIEDEVAVRGQTLALERIGSDDLREEVIGLARAGLAPVAETTLKRTTRLLRSDRGALVELAIDVGEVRAQGKAAPLREAELELVEGHPGDLFAMAAELFTRGPVRLSNQSKSARALMLAEKGHAIEPLAPRKARRIVLEPDQTAEAAAGVALGACLDQALANIPVTVATDDPGGPHQLRVGLRRLRSAISAFRPVLGRESLAPIGDAARRIAAEVGRLRDLDVLIDEMIAGAADRHPGERGLAVLRDAFEARRTRVREEVRTFLCGAEATAFGFQAASFLAGRGWLDPADHDQTVRLAEPVRKLARRRLDKRWKALSAFGHRIEALSIPERHEMRKEIKKMRYIAEIFRSLADPDRFTAFRQALRALQDDFGALNDVAMAEAYLVAADAPAADDPAAQRAVGRLIGGAEAEADNLWPKAVADWRALAQTGPFWR